MLLTQNRVSRTHKGRYPVGPSWASSASISVLNAPKKTSDHTKRSSRDLEGRVLSGPERLDRVVELTGLQAVVELPEQAVEEVPKRSGVPIAAVASSALMVLGCAGFRHRGERPKESCSVESVVLHHAAGNRDAAPGGPRDQHRTGVGPSANGRR